MEKPVEELEKTWELCQGIDFSRDRAGLESNLLEPTASLLGAETSVFRVFPVDVPRPVILVGLGIRDAVHDAYLDRYVKLDPVRRLSTQRFATPLIADHDQSMSEAWSDKHVAMMRKAGTPGAAVSLPAQHLQEFRRYLREFLLPNGFYHHLGFCFQDKTGSQTFLLDYHRTESLPPFGRLEIARAKIIALLLHARAAEFGSVADLDGHRCHGELSRGRHPDDCHTAGFDGRLSARELEVAEVVARGLTNKEVGDALGISVRTVENHMRSIFAKLKISTRTRLAARLHEIKSKRPVIRRRLI